MKRALAVLILLSFGAAAADKRDYSLDTARRGPEWLRSGVIYEIYPRAFSSEGTFAGITARLDGLEKLGVSVLWLMPVNPIGQTKKKGTIGSPYSVRDYYGINPDYGTAPDLKKLIAEAHRRGFKVILDVVPNHTSWDSVMMQHPEYYKQDAAGHIISPVPDWQDVAGLNYANAGLRAYMAAMFEWWLREFDLDGFRCDVASGVPVDFWEETRVRLEKVKPGMMMLAEAAEPALMARAFDADYAWPFHSALTEVLQSGRPARALREVWQQERATFPRGALHMRFSDNHDEKRAIARFGERGALAASALIFAMDGVPMLYNGMEAGDTTESGAPALFEKLPVFWPIVERRPDFPALYESLIALRRGHAALQQGETVWLENADAERVVTLLRRAGDEEFLVVVNLSNRPFRGRVSLDRVERFSEIPLPSVKPGTAALPELELDAWGFRLFRR